MATEGLPKSFLALLRRRLLAWVTPGSSGDDELNPRRRPSNLLYDVDDVPRS
jgi:hypothetical protein